MILMVIHMLQRWKIVIDQKVRLLSRRDGSNRVQLPCGRSRRCTYTGCINIRRSSHPAACIQYSLPAHTRQYQHTLASTNNPTCRKPESRRPRQSRPQRAPSRGHCAYAQQSLSAKPANQRFASVPSSPSTRPQTDACRLTLRSLQTRWATTTPASLKTRTTASAQS